MKFLKALAHTELRKWTPQFIKSFIRERFNVLSYDMECWYLSNSLSEAESISSYPSKYPFTLGIIREMTCYHQHYVAACRELKVSYKILDISSNNWINTLRDARCDAFLVWPSALLAIWKQMYDDRLKIMVEDLGQVIYPSLKEIWIWESKRRMRDWLMAHDIPHPRTDVFYDLDEALNFIDSADLPLVMKTDRGASSHGVTILRSRRKARKLIEKAFHRGIVIERGDKRDKQWGNVLLQEFIPDATEWRMVRIGNSFFGHPKGKVGDFHSGSGKVLWDNPSSELLDMLLRVTEAGGFTSMNLDIFQTRTGRYLVNELQTVFGASFSKDQLKVNGKAGRYVHSETFNKWIFEEGDFARNACANLRVECLLNSLENMENRNSGTKVS